MDKTPNLLINIFVVPLHTSVQKNDDNLYQKQCPRAVVERLKLIQLCPFSLMKLKHHLADSNVSCISFVDYVCRLALGRAFPASVYWGLYPCT